MCLEYLKPGTLKDRKATMPMLEKFSQSVIRLITAVQTKVLSSYGITSRFSYNLSFADLDRELANGRPVVIGILHRGTLSSPTGGHMLVVIGKTAIWRLCCE
jgi:hypothetical protein